MCDLFSEYAETVATTVRAIDNHDVLRAFRCIEEVYATKQSVFCCGNGGGAAIASHAVCDLQKTVRDKTGRGLKAIDLNGNASLISAVANDVDYDEVFALQLSELATPGDLLLVFSVSGESRNVNRALEVAAELQLRTISITGSRGGKSRELAELNISIPSSSYAIVEDCQQAIIHSIIESLQRKYRLTSLCKRGDREVQRVPA